MTRDHEKDMEPELSAEALEALRSGYNTPSDVPRERMWVAIESAIGGGRPDEDVVEIDRIRRRRFGGAGTWLGGLLAASVVAWMGFGLGRMTAPPTPVSGAGARPSANVMRTAAATHLLATESLLEVVRVDARRGVGLDAAVADRSRGLLTRTRLLLDAGDALEPEVRRLLEDLEFVLVQVALIADGGLAPDRYRGEVELLEEDLDEQNLLPRIRAVVPEPGLMYTAG